MADDLLNDAAGIFPKKKPAKRVKKKKRGIITSFLILFIVLAALVSVLAFNLFNLRDLYIYPFLAQIPFIGGFIPPTSDMPENFGAMSREEMIARINSLEEQLYNAKREVLAVEETVDANRSEINRLKVFEEQQLDFKREKADFDRRIAMSDPQAFKDYYESIYPENAEVLYPYAEKEASRISEIKKYLNDITQMDETSAANVLQQMIGTDMDLVVSIIQNLESRNAGSILSEMDTLSAASVIKMMAPFSTNSAPYVYPALTPTEIVNEQTELP